MDKNRFFLETSYLGTHYHGWQVQDNANSIQHELEAALSTLLRQKISITGCGRTDTGVHALQHYSHFDVERHSFDELFIHHLNSILPRDISVWGLHPMHPLAHSRFDAVSRVYEYRLHFSKNPFLFGLSTFCSYYPNVESMEEATRILIGSADFSAFSKTHTQVKTHLCRISEANWSLSNNQLIFTIKADRFLRNMVRAIVGTLLQVGWGDLSLSQFKRILESGQRSQAGASVGAEGLYLHSVRYPYPVAKPMPIQRQKIGRTER